MSVTSLARELFSTEKIKPASAKLSKYIGGMLLAAFPSYGYAQCNLDPWQPASSMNIDRHGAGVAAYDSCLYAAGGNFDARNTSTESAAIQADGSLGSWQFTSNMQDERIGAPAVAHNGYFYALGGYQAAGPTVACERAPIQSTDCTLGPWERIQSLPVPVNGSPFVVKNGWIYIIAAGLAANLDDLYPGGPANPWVSMLVPAISRWAGSAAVVDNYVYAFGGLDAGAGDSTERTQIIGPGSLGPWEAVPGTLNQPRFNAGGSSNCGCIYAIGGNSPSSQPGDPSLNSVEFLSGGQWSAAPPLNQRRGNAGIAAWGDFIYAVGGEGGYDSSYLTTVEFSRAASSGIEVRRYLSASDLPPVDSPEAVFPCTNMPWSDPDGLLPPSHFYQVNDVQDPNLRILLTKNGSTLLVQ